jgi:hypothetical protein
MEITIPEAGPYPSLGLQNGLESVTLKPRLSHSTLKHYMGEMADST